MLTKGTNGVKAKFIGKPWMGSKKKAIWVPKSLVTNLQGPKQVWVPKRIDFLLQVNYKARGRHQVLDSGCTQHMTSDARMFNSINTNGNDGYDTITFGDNGKGKVKGLGKIAISNVSTKYGRQSTQGYAQGSRLSVDRCASFKQDGDARQTRGFIQVRPPRRRNTYVLRLICIAVCQ